MLLKQFSLILFPFLLFANDGDILSAKKTKDLDLKLLKTQTETDKLEKSWIEPVVVSFSKGENQIGTNSENSYDRYSLSISQDIFRSGGIFYAIDYAKAQKKYGRALVESEKNTLIAQAYTILYYIKKLELQEEKQALLIANSKLDIKRKRELFLAGELDSGFLDNAILEKNRLENILLDIKTQKFAQIKEFRNISDFNSNEVALPVFKLVSKNEFLNSSLLLKIKEDSLQTKEFYQKITRAKYLPKVNFKTSYNYEDTEAKNSNQSSASDYYTYAFTLSMPLDMNYQRDIEISKLDKLIARNELEQKKEEEANFFDMVENTIAVIEEKKIIAQKDLELYNSLIAQTKEQFEAGIKTEDDLKTMLNSQESKNLDIKILSIDKNIEIIKLLGRVIGGF